MYRLLGFNGGNLIPVALVHKAVVGMPVSVLVTISFLQFHAFGVQHFRDPFLVDSECGRPTRDCVEEERLPVLHLTGRWIGFNNRLGQLTRDRQPLLNAGSSEMHY